jgi:hypothetical protein
VLKALDALRNCTPLKTRIDHAVASQGVVTAKLCILAIGAVHPDSALSSDTQRADFLQKTYFVESPSFGMRLPGLLPEDSSL